MGNDAPFVIATSIQDLQTGIPIENLFKIKRETSNQVNVIFNEFDISDLPSGNYNLTISVRDKENKEITSQNIFFQRSNPGVKFNTTSIQNLEIVNSFVSRMNNADTLREFIRMCGPISSASEKLFMLSNLQSGGIRILQQFFLSFWTLRNQLDPEGEWIKYFRTVQGVQQEFGCTNSKGYETDRGRVYLQYGPPNQRVIEPYTASTLPYEIWQYYKYEKQTDLKFIFYTRDRSICDYILAHSTAIGEVKNVNWQYEIRGLPSPLDTDNSLYKRPYEINSFGEQSGEFFNNPR
jgi:GWxTD domain-containing protein